MREYDRTVGSLDLTGVYDLPTVVGLMRRPAFIAIEPQPVITTNRRARCTSSRHTLAQQPHKPLIARLMTFNGCVSHTPKVL
jgi:hypothetical protein